MRKQPDSFQLDIGDYTVSLINPGYKDNDPDKYPYGRQEWSKFLAEDFDAAIKPWKLKPYDKHY